MKRSHKLSIVLASLILSSSYASAQNVGRCGWGSKLFEGKKGIIPQVFAVTTNGTSGNQTFAITSGTSGCTQDGVVRSNWNGQILISANLNGFAQDVARGEGENLDALAYYLKVKPEHKNRFNTALKNNFDNIFTSQSISSEQVASSVREVLASDDVLKQYS